MRTAIALFACAILSACQTTAPDVPQTRSPVATMEAVARQAQACWFKAGDKAFRPYRLQAELNSMSGRPRILVVPRGDQAALPVLVAQAEADGAATRFQSFGPLLGKPGGERISAQLAAWSNGSRTC